MDGRLLVGALSATAAVSLAMADDLPHYKPGLWEITMVMASKPADEKICLDASTEKAMNDMGRSASKRLCTKAEIHSSGSTYTSVATCKDDMVRSVMTFTGDSRYHLEITSHPNSGNQPNRKSSMDGKWLGACPADMKPGDALVSVEGLGAPMRMNILKGMAGN